MVTRNDYKGGRIEYFDTDMAARSRKLRDWANVVLGIGLHAAAQKLLGWELSVVPFVTLFVSFILWRLSVIAGKAVPLIRHYDIVSKYPYRAKEDASDGH